MTIASSKTDNSTSLRESDKRPTRLWGDVAPKSTSRIRPAKIRKPNTLARFDWELNHLLIEKAVFTLIHKLNRSPKLAEIAQQVGMSVEGVRQHIKTIDLSDTTTSTRIYVRKVLDAQALRAMKGKREDVALYMALNFNWTPRIQVDANTTFQIASDSKVRIQRITELLVKSGMKKDQLQAFVYELSGENIQPEA